jgi:hypothetical protein
MKVLNLRCANGHGFEGWFSSEEDFLGQNGSGQIECPICTDSVVTRLPSAPRLNLSAAREPAVAEPSTPADKAEPAVADMQAMYLQAVRRAMANTKDVGPRFAEEARRIHYGETAAQGIRGTTSPEERAALQDEGIEVMSLPIPAALKETLQ